MANSAVSAAEDVRSTVRAARTAANAKSTANTAARDAQKACEQGKFNSLDEARASETRASIAQSHAIHAAVVEHEAKTVKRRATLALAHDVKCWNVHRKREVLQTVLSYARSQHEATRRAVDAWSCLRDGFVGSAVVPSTQARRSRAAPKPSIDIFNDEVQTTIYGSSNGTGQQQTIVAVEHDLLNQSSLSSKDLSIDSSKDSGTYSTGEVITSAEPETILPLVLASPIPEEPFPEDDEEAGYRQGNSDFAKSSNSQSQTITTSPHTGVAASIHSQSFASSSAQSKPQVETEKTQTHFEGAEILTSSMQSLVDGLMNWGGQYDDEEDLTLPTGMAASIAIEGSCILSSQKII